MDNTYHIRGIPANLCTRMWPFAEPYIKRALDHAAGEITPDDLLLSCLRREVQLWLVACEDRIIGAATTEIVRYPRKKHCRVITIAGSHFADWLVLIEGTLAAWAAEQGCCAMEAHVRKGLVPKLTDIGYKHLHSVVHRNIAIIPQATHEGDATWQKKAVVAAASK